MKLDRSHALCKRAQALLPGGVGGSGCRGLPLWDPYWPFADRGKGSRIYDVDGNEWIDYLAGYGPLILGHAPPKLIEAVTRQLQRGSLHGMCHELEAQVAEKLVKHVPSAEKVKFTNSGTDAVLHALRLARAYTSRQKVVKFEGSYHGWADSVYFSVNPLLEVAGSPESPNVVFGTVGQAKSAAEDVIVLPWNDLEALERAMDKYGTQIAALLLEPYIHNAGCIPPKAGYLQAARQITEQRGIVLVFDEVITGFRLALGGAQAYFGVTPDLTTLAKGMGGGFPVAAVVGKKEIMDLAIPGKADWYGTYSASPLALTAVLATLEALEADDGVVYSRLFDLGQRIMSGLQSSAARWGIQAVVQGPGPSWSIFFTDLQQITNYREAAQSDREKYHEFWEESMKRGVMFHPYYLQNWYVTTAHTEEDVEQTLAAVDEALKVTAGA